MSVGQITRPSRSSNLRKGVLCAFRPAKASPFGRGVTEGDGEGKPGTKEHLHSDKHWLLIESSYRCVFVLSQRPCPLRRSAPAPPKGEPFSASARNLRESPQNLREWQLQGGGGGGYNGSIKNTQENGGYDHETEKAPCPRPCGGDDAGPAHRLFRRRKRRGQARRGGRRRPLQGQLPKRQSLLRRPRTDPHHPAHVHPGLVQEVPERESSGWTGTSP